MIGEVNRDGSVFWTTVAATRDRALDLQGLGWRYLERSAEGGWRMWARTPDDRRPPMPAEERTK